MRLFDKIFLFMLFYTLILYSIKADTIILKNGNTINGKIIDELKNCILIETDGRKIIISKIQIKKITKQNNISGNKLKIQKQNNIDTQTLSIYNEILNNPEADENVKSIFSRKQTKTFIEAIKKSEIELDRKNYLLAIGMLEKNLIEFSDSPYNDIIQSKLSVIYSAQSLIYIKDKNFTKAAGAIRKSLEYDPFSSNAHFNFGLLIVHQNDRLYIAKQEFELALKYDPNHKMAKFYVNLLSDIKSPEIELPPADLIPKTTEESLSIEIAKAMDSRIIREEKLQYEEIFYDYYKDKREIALLLAGYNAGPTAVITYQGKVPYPETKEYIKRVFHYLDNTIPQTKYDDLINKKSIKYNLDPNLIKAIVKVESDFNHFDVTHNWAGGARGLIQLIKEDWDDTIKRMNVNWKYEKDVFDPEKNLEVGCHYLDWLIKNHVPKWLKNNFIYSS